MPLPHHISSLRIERQIKNIEASTRKDKAEILVFLTSLIYFLI